MHPSVHPSIDPYIRINLIQYIHIPYIQVHTCLSACLYVSCRYTCNLSICIYTCLQYGIHYEQVQRVDGIFL